MIQPEVRDFGTVNNGHLPYDNHATGFVTDFYSIYKPSSDHSECVKPQSKPNKAPLDGDPRGNERRKLDTL